MIKSHWNTLTKNGKPRKRKKYPSLNKIRCRKCKKPFKAPYGSSKLLKVFEITYYHAESGEQYEFSDTQESKFLFEMVRRSEFCDCVPNKPTKMQNELREVCEQVLGENASKNAKRRFIRYGKLPK